VIEISEIKIPKSQREKNNSRQSKAHRSKKKYKDPKGERKFSTLSIIEKKSKL